MLTDTPNGRPNTKELIVRYLARRGVACGSELAADLNAPFMQVMDALHELEAQGVVQKSVQRVDPSGYHAPPAQAMYRLSASH